MSRHLILDGYNIIRQTSGFAELALDVGRQRLIRTIERQRPQGSGRNQITVVFDGRPGRERPAASETVQVVFSEDRTADDWIKEFVGKTDNPRQVVVVTNDRDIQFHVKALGAAVWSVAEFMRKMVVPVSSGEMTPAGKRTGDSKTIDKTLEYKITQELEKVWLEKRKSK